MKVYPQKVCDLSDIKGLCSQTFPVLQTFVPQSYNEELIDFLLSSDEIDKPVLMMYRKTMSNTARGNDKD